MNINEIINHWQIGAEDAFDTAAKLIEAKKYHHALFFCHLALEKMVKSKVVQSTQKPPPAIHDLVRLAEIAKIKLNSTQEDELNEINGFNLKTRYDEYKSKFYKKASQSYSKTWHEKSKKYLKWLKKI